MRLKHVLMLAIGAMAIESAATAADFSALAPTGQTLYFNLDGEGGAILTFPGTSFTYAWVDHTQPTGALTLPDTVIYQGQPLAVRAVGYAAFRGCDGITQLTIPQGITKIESMAFYDCHALAQVSIAASVDSIKNLSFYNCTALTQVEVRRPTPPFASTGTFAGTMVVGEATLAVNCGATALYAAEVPWNRFGTISETACSVHYDILPNYPQRGSTTGSGDHAYGTPIAVAAQPAVGYLFACWSDGDTLNPRTIEAVADVALTAFFFEMRHDTIPFAVHDTLVLYDTLVLHDTVSLSPTYYTLAVGSAQPQQGVAAGSTTVPEGTPIEVAAIPTEGYRFSHWSDGNSDNPRQVVIESHTSLVAYFAPTATGISPTAVPPYAIGTAGRQIRVEAAAGTAVSIYDSEGRLLHSSTAPTLFSAPTPGVYLVRVGQGAARRVVVGE